VNVVPGSSLSITIDAVEDDPATVSVIVAEPERPSLSVVDAVMVCVPSESDDVENETPLPMSPSRLECHDRLLEM